MVASSREVCKVGLWQTQCIPIAGCYFNLSADSISPPRCCEGGRVATLHIENQARVKPSLSLACRCRSESLLLITLK
ncbi:hypothetical protein J6590_089027 [Homalodisca vitripennis]|nr:hypothetical protein J6590_089027 [Homalodisca vitripennis]